MSVSISNPACESVSGCGPWERPMVKNPAFKGKWKAPLIKNPGFQGKWKAKQIPNPNYFDEPKPFKLLTPIGAIGLELWTMSEGLAFDNFLVTDDAAIADAFARATWGPKASQETREASKGSFFGGLIETANEKPWLWAVYLLVILIPVILIAVCCFPSNKNKEAEAKKTDAAQPDDEEEPPKLVPKAAASKADLEDDEEEEEEEEEEGEEEEEPKPKASPGRRNLRQRKAD